MNNEQEKEFKKLERENEKIRNKLQDIFMGTPNDEDKNKIWGLIEELINNEIEQEKYCNQ